MSYALDSERRAACRFLLEAWFTSATSTPSYGRLAKAVGEQLITWTLASGLMALAKDSPSAMLVVVLVVATLQGASCIWRKVVPRGTWLEGLLGCAIGYVVMWVAGFIAAALGVLEIEGVQIGLGVLGMAATVSATAIGLQTGFGLRPKLRLGDILWSEVASRMVHVATMWTPLGSIATHADRIAFGGQAHPYTMLAIRLTFVLVIVGGYRARRTRTSLWQFLLVCLGGVFAWNVIQHRLSSIIFFLLAIAPVSPVMVKRPGYVEWVLGAAHVQIVPAGWTDVVVIGVKVLAMVFVWCQTALILEHGMSWSGRVAMTTLVRVVVAVWLLFAVVLVTNLGVLRLVSMVAPHIQTDPKYVDWGIVGFGIASSISLCGGLWLSWTLPRRLARRVRVPATWFDVNEVRRQRAEALQCGIAQAKQMVRDLAETARGIWTSATSVLGGLLRDA